MRAMPPKKLRKLGEPKSSPETLALENINGKYFDDLAATMSVVMAHKSFGRHLRALPKDKGGIVEPPSQATFKSGEVVVGANLASINEAQMVLPGAPCSQRKSRSFATTSLKTPRGLTASWSATLTMKFHSMGSVVGHASAQWNRFTLFGQRSPRISRTTTRPGLNNGQLWREHPP